jgi:hypothetical protein
MNVLPPLGGNMTKKKLIGGVLAGLLLLSTVPYASASEQVTEQVYAKSAPTATVVVATITPAVVKQIEKPKPEFACQHFLAKALYKAGFRSNGLRIAWAIAMRESGGKANAISSTGDYGVFQFNRAAHSRQPWWNTSKMLERNYNIMIAFDMSQGGKTFYPWDIDGKGRHKGNYTSSGVYNKYKSWYNKYPEYCKK